MHDSLHLVMFYVLTNAATSTRDEVYGFFSKVGGDFTGTMVSVSCLRAQEKVSFDNYNLACIVILPPHQQKGFGTLLIEFSKYACFQVAAFNH